MLVYYLSWIQAARFWKGQNNHWNTLEFIPLLVSLKIFFSFSHNSLLPLIQISPLSCVLGFMRWQCCLMIQRATTERSCLLVPSVQHDLNLMSGKMEMMPYETKFYPFKQLQKMPCSLSEHLFVIPKSQKLTFFSRGLSLLIFVTQVWCPPWKVTSLRLLGMSEVGAEAGTR